MNKTPLHHLHEEHGARMVDFEGWSMPLQYDGILPEHRHTRKAASLFDTCHMTEYRVEGPSSTDALTTTLACRIRSLEVGQCRYGFLLNQSGGVIDDLVCYRLGESQYMIVANAGTHNQVNHVLQERLGGEASLTDLSNETAKIDIQGPWSGRVLRDTWDSDWSALDYFSFAQATLNGISTLVSRTGYTGELGFELYVAAEEVETLCGQLLEHSDLKPAGLGARDTLRLEMGYPLYGHELDESTTPVEAGLEEYLPEEASYVGHETIERQLQDGPEMRRIGIQFEGRRAARPGDDILVEDEAVGCISSGAFAPSLGRAVGMGYVDGDSTEDGQTVQAAVRSHRIDGTVTQLPFYQNGTVCNSVTNPKGE